MSTLLPDQSDAARERLEAQFAHRVVTRLNAHLPDLHQDVSERLRVAREQSLVRARQAKILKAEVSSTQVLGLGRGQLALGWGSPKWLSWGTAIPLFALVVGLASIQIQASTASVSAAAEIDAALLADSLPPKAYTDPGFVEYLKSIHD
jgi:hypothetical protein